MLLQQATKRGRTWTNRRFKIAKWRDRLRVDLPAINNAADLDQATADEVFHALAPIVAEVQLAFADQLEFIDRETARDLVQITGFALCAIERHFQKQGKPPGASLSLLPGMPGFLLELAQVAEHPGYFGHGCYWFRNREEPITFTNDPQELLFLNAVVNTGDLHRATNDGLRKICVGDVDIATAQAAEILKHAARNTEEVHDWFCRLMAKSPDGSGRNLEPFFFMTKLRDNLVAIRLGNKTISGPNAANMCDQMQQDFLSGTFNSAYYGLVVTKRMEYQTREDKEALIDDMTLSKMSIMHRLIDRIGMSEQQVIEASHEEIAAKIATQSEAYHNSLSAYVEFFDAICTLTAKHFAEIKLYLERGGKQLTPEQVARLAVKPTHGTGGMPHSDTEAVMRMRKDHPVINQLTKAAKLAIH